jgi:hypothetical protein
MHEFDSSRPFIVYPENLKHVCGFFGFGKNKNSGRDPDRPETRAEAFAVAGANLTLSEQDVPASSVIGVKPGQKTPDGCSIVSLVKHGNQFVPVTLEKDGHTLERMGIRLSEVQAQKLMYR